MRSLPKEFEIAPLDRNIAYRPGDIIRFGNGRVLRVLQVSQNRIQVTEGPSERQLTLSRLTGRPVEDFIP